MAASPTTLADLAGRRTDPAAPLLTYYDQATGERVELSGTTTANWVAKTSNFLVDDLDAGPGTRIRIGLPTHWLRFVWLLSAWNVGAVVAESRADIGVSGPDLIADEPHRVAASLRPLGGRFPEPPADFLDLAIEVPGCSDRFIGLDPPAPQSLALDLGSPATHADLLEHAPDPRRLLIEPGDLGRDATLLVAACTGNGSLVIVASATPEQIASVAQQESAVVPGQIH